MPFSIDRYFDNAATTPVDPHVLEAMLPYFGTEFGNAHSVHSWGLAARKAVERAREQVAALIGAEDPLEVVFTSGATESNNWVLRAFEDAAVGPFEHSSVFELARRTGRTILQNSGLGVLAPERNHSLISQMRVNNEIGAVFEVSDLASSCDALHSDITQAMGKIPVHLEETPVDFASFSAHKFYGPKGVGGLFVKGGRFLVPLLEGGEQEDGRRSGTSNVPGIVGMGEAARIARDRLEQDLAHAANLRRAVVESIRDVPDLRVNGGEHISPFILSLSFRGLEGEALVLELDRAGFAISSGAACSSRTTEPSWVLTALGYEPEWLRGTIRISFGRFNTVASAQGLAKALRAGVGTLLGLQV